VVQYFHDDAGRIVRKRVIDNTVQETINTRYETEWEYDGMGRMVRERTLQYDASAEKDFLKVGEHHRAQFLQC
jgi:YD repeat-containing protein